MIFALNNENLKGYFRVSKTLTFRTRLVAKPFLSSCENEFHLRGNKNHFHINGFALSLALKQKIGETLRWPIQQMERT